MTRLILENFGADWNTAVKPVEDRKGHDLRYSVDCRKAQDELGYEPKVPFQDGLAETIQWYRDNPNWWRPLKESQ
jgi:dTDP-glucose 4,6-dehydratase